MSSNNETPQGFLRASAQDEFAQSSLIPKASKHVLTIFGNAPTPKQLFSSLQKPTRVNGAKEKVIVPIREAGLPSGIATTQIIPTHPSNMMESRKRSQTLGEIFPTPPSVTPSIPPKPSVIATTKSTTVCWYHPSSIGPLSKTLNYFNQNVASGQWVDYSKTSSSGRCNKLKHMDRTLDFGLNKRLPTEKEVLDTESDRLESLFQSAYSSFAPTKDNAAAIAPTGCLDRMWWHEVGEKCFRRLCHSTRFKDEETIEASETYSNDDLKAFEKGLEELQKNSADLNVDAAQDRVDRAVQDRDTEEILNEISGLLETLTSYQRIRHLSLNASSRPHGIFSASDTISSSTPLKPSDSELATYEILKSHLCLMISKLPPYAISKINSERFADLNISTKIEVKVNDYRGVMEEDEISSKNRPTGSINSPISSSRAPNQSAHRGISGNSASNVYYGNQFSSSQSRGSTSHYYNSIQNAIRTPSASIQRSPSTVSASYQGQRVSSSGPYRSSPFGMSYSHQSARPTQPLYTPTTPQLQYPQTSPVQGFLRAPSQSYHQHTSQSIAQSIIGNRYTNQSVYQSQSQAQLQSNGNEYNRYGNNLQTPRQSSSQKGNYSPQAVSTQPQRVVGLSENTNPQPQNNSTQAEPALTKSLSTNSISASSVKSESQEPGANLASY